MRSITCDHQEILLLVIRLVLTRAETEEITQEIFVDLQDVLKTSSTSLQRTSKTSSRRLERRKIVTPKTS